MAGISGWESGAGLWHSATTTSTLSINISIEIRPPSSSFEPPAAQQHPLTNGTTTGSPPTTNQDPPTPTDPTDTIGPGTCKRKRCERHRAWLKNQQTDNAFERDLVRQGVRRLEAEERAVRERGVLRGLEGMGEGEGEGKEGEDGGNG